MNEQYRPSPLSSAAFVLSLIAAVSMLFIYVSVPLGALAIILALLSRGNRKLYGKARTALLISAAAIAGSIFITGYSFYRVWTDPELKAQFSQFLDYYLTYYNGADFSEDEAAEKEEDAAPAAPHYTYRYHSEPGGSPAAAFHGGTFT